MGIAASELFTFFADATNISLQVTNIAETTADVIATCNSSGGSLYVAFRTTAPYGPTDANAVKTGTASFRKIFFPPAPTNNVTATGLQPGFKYYVGLVHSYNDTDSVVASAEITMLTYPVTNLKPYQVNNYPDLQHYRDVPVHEDLSYGVGGTAPITFAANKLPSGISMDSAGRVSGSIPDSIGITSGIVVTATNAYGSTAFPPFSWTIGRVSDPPVEGMTRKELFDLAKLYSDRFDADVDVALPKLCALAEGRISRMIRISEMSEPWTTDIVDGREYYELPHDFAGIRNIQYVFESGSKVSPQYVNPEQANRAMSDGNHYYTIMTDRLRLAPPVSGDGYILLAYYQRIPPLVGDGDSNWMLAKYPDVYISALMAEIETFVKNDERHLMWLAKLDKSFSELTTKDQHDRWSGHSLTIKSEIV